KDTRGITCEGESSSVMPLPVLEYGQAAPAPVLGLDLLDDDEGRFEGLVENVEQELADAGDEPGLFIGRDGAAAGAGALPRNLDRDHRHGILPLVAGALAAINVKDLARHEAGGFEVENGVDDIA